MQPGVQYDLRCVHARRQQFQPSRLIARHSQCVVDQQGGIAMGIIATEIQSAKREKI